MLKTFWLKKDENYDKSVRVCNFYSNKYTEHESNGDKLLSIKEYPNKIRPYLKDINNIKKSATR